MKRKLRIWCLAALGILPSPVWAEEIWGYPISPIQAKFYLLILYLILFSIIMVSSVYFLFWILNLNKMSKKQKTAQGLKPALAD